MELMMKYDSMCVELHGSSAEFQRVADALDCLLDILHSKKCNKLTKTAFDDLYFDLRYISSRKQTDRSNNTTVNLCVPFMKAGLYGYLTQLILQSSNCSKDIASALLTLKEHFYDELAKNIGNNNHNQLLLLYQNIAQDHIGWVYLKWLQQYIASATKQSDVYDPLKNIFSILTSPTTTYEQFRQHIYNFKHSQESDELYADEVISYINSKLLT